MASPNQPQATGKFYMVSPGQDKLLTSIISTEKLEFLHLLKRAPDCQFPCTCF